MIALLFLLNHNSFNFIFVNGDMSSFLCVLYMCSANRGQTRTLDPLGLVLQTVVSPPICVLGTETGSLSRKQVPAVPPLQILYISV